MRVVLLPGMDGTGDLFERFVAARPAGVEIFAPHLVLQTAPHEAWEAVTGRWSAVHRAS